VDNSNTWPAFIYLFCLFAFNVTCVELAFDCMGAVIKTTKSSFSVSVDVQVKDSQEIDKYLEVSDIKGIVSL
jgi:hypothetical protein